MKHLDTKKGRKSMKKLWTSAPDTGVNTKDHDRHQVFSYYYQHIKLFFQAVQIIILLESIVLCAGFWDMGMPSDEYIQRRQGIID